MPRAVVTGGAGFLGSHLCERLLSESWEVICFDSLLTGSTDNLGRSMPLDRFRLKHYDVTNMLYVEGGLDWVLHFASPASPRDYLEYPIHTLKLGAIGTMHALGLAKEKGAGFLLASSSEIYGDPKMHPQPETYWGNVNPTGPRSVYDEAKRFAEALASAYARVHGIPVKIARIFNTYGPRMRRDDGRAVPSFIQQALSGRPLTVHGDGSQTRSLCFVDDLIEGLWRLIVSDVYGPVNLGGPVEITVLDLAELINKISGGDSDVNFLPRPIDDPEIRCPDITLARERLNWEPCVSLEEGLEQTVGWAKTAWF